MVELVEWRNGVNEILTRHQLTMKDIHFRHHAQRFVRCRREIAEYLRGREWSLHQIGDFIQRDHSTVWNLLNPGKKKKR